MPVAGGVSLFFFLPPALFGAGSSVVFAVDFVLAVFLSDVFFAAGFLLADFFLVDFFSGAGLTVSAGAFVCSNDSPSSTLAIVYAETTLALYSK